MSSQISEEHRAQLCLLCHSTDGSQLHMMFPYKSFLVFSLIAWVTIHTPCSHLSLSTILALVSAMVDVCAWGFCLLQYLCSSRYVDNLLPLSDSDVHGPDKLHTSLPVALASRWYPVSSIISVTTVPTRSCILSSLMVSFECSQLVQGLFMTPRKSAWLHCRKCHDSHYMVQRVLLVEVPSACLDTVPLMEMVQVISLCMNLNSRINVCLSYMPIDLES